MARKTPQPLKKPGFAEFITLMAFMMSLVALSIDTMLPALSVIGKELGVMKENSNQLIISMLFLGMAAGQLLYGPISDSTGRKPAIYLGYAIFILGCLLSLFAMSFPVMLAGRVLQGFGAAGPRVISLALVRDQYEGRKMARVMSFVMTIFILVPMIAPALGQAVIMLAGWRAIFATFLVIALVSLVWFAIRQPESLEVQKRIPHSLKRLQTTLKEILTNRHALGYTITAGLVSGAFIGYLNSAQQIFQGKYALAERFPLYFALLAFSLGSASLFNAKLVVRYSMHSLCRRALFTINGISAALLLVELLQHHDPTLALLMVYLLITFFSTGILFGNLNALAMEPLGRYAGVGAGVVGSLSTFISLIIGTAIGQSYNGTAIPLTAGFFVVSGASLGVMRWTDKKDP